MPGTDAIDMSASCAYAAAFEASFVDGLPAGVSQASDSKEQKVAEGEVKGDEEAKGEEDVKEDEPEVEEEGEKQEEGVKEDQTAEPVAEESA